MDLQLDPGTYVVAVSGGVDSMSLLHALAGRKDLKLVVAHLDHGIRSDSAEDLRLVRDFAKRNKIPFIYDKARLGPNASEDAARKARYEFLHKVREASMARGIITAHHQDDLVETAVMKLLRGTGRSGLSALRGGHVLHRPMLHIPKHQIKRYALDNQIVWREDSTNTDTRYLRNHIRHNLLPKMTNRQRGDLLDILDTAHQTNQQIHSLLTAQLHLQPAANQLFRKWFIDLPHAVAKEAMAQWLRNNGLREFDKKGIERLVAAAKTLEPGKKVDVQKGYNLEVRQKVLALVPIER